MQVAAVRRAPAPSVLVKLALVAALLALAAVGWLVTDERMAGMDMGPGTAPGTLGFWVSSWVVMMAAMMFPSIAPMVLMHHRIQQGKRARGQAVDSAATPLFVAGYLLTWSAAGLAGYTILWAGHAWSPGFLDWDNAGPYVAGAAVLVAGLYQLTPFKDRCLTKCRSPFEFLLAAWRPGRLGALRMGIVHGAWCVGCCWALMVALLALGAMSVGWMLFIAALIAFEKLLPAKTVANRSIAVLLVVLGLGVAFAAEDVPGLTVPSESAGPAMQMQPHGGSMESQHDSMRTPHP
jgi:predicted metal-binding membrane protein